MTRKVTMSDAEMHELDVDLRKAENFAMPTGRLIFDEDPKTQTMYRNRHFHQVQLPRAMNDYFARFNWRRFNTKNALRDSVSLLALQVASNAVRGQKTA